ncbi:hypothetical protein [Geodermatophilus sp. URMC 64]
MLSDSEQRVWDDVERFWAEDAQEPARPGRRANVRQRAVPRELDDAPVAVIGGVWGAIFLVLFDAQVAGLVVAAAAALGLAVWRYSPLPRSSRSTATRSPAQTPSLTDRRTRRPVEMAYHGRLWRWSEED